MKKILQVTFVFILISSVGFAQGYDINYDISIKYNCDEQSTIFIESGSVNEGDFIEFPQYTIPEQFIQVKKFQKFLNLFANAVVEIPIGTLKEDVTFKITINPFPCNTDEIDFKQLFGVTFLVIGSESGEHLPLDYYEFNDNQKATIKIKASNLSDFLSDEGIAFGQIIAWFINKGLAEDLEGIKFSWTVGDEWAYIDLEHFSKIEIGIKNSPTIVKDIDAISTNYKLLQNFPNPFNPSTIISFSLPKNGFTKLILYNSLGVEVANLLSEEKSAGNYTISFNAINLPSGIYFYNLISGNFNSTRKMLLIK